MSSNWYYRILAVFLAVVSWYLVTGRERVDTWVQGRIEISGLTDSVMVQGRPHNSLEVLVRGPKGLAGKLEPGNLVYTLDARKFAIGRNTVAMEPDAIPVARPLEVVEIRPSTIEVSLARRDSKSLPVRLSLDNELARNFTTQATFDPPQVTVSGPESALAGMADVPTQPVALPDELAGSLDAAVGLQLPDQVDAAPRTVKTHLEFRVNMREVSMDVKIEPRYTGKGHVSVTPSTAAIRVKVPVTFEPAGPWRGFVEAFVAVDAKTPPGRHEMAYHVTLPKGGELVQAKPEHVIVQIK